MHFALLIVRQYDLRQTLLAICLQIIKSVRTHRLKRSFLLVHWRKDFVLHWVRLGAESVASRLLLFLLVLDGEVLSEEIFGLFVGINSFGRFFVTSTGDD